MMALDEEAEIMDRFNELRALGILMRNCDGSLDTEDVAGVGEIIFDLIRDIPGLVDRIDAETRRKKVKEEVITENPKTPQEATWEPTEAHEEEIAETSVEVKGLDNLIDSIASESEAEPEKALKKEPPKRKSGRLKKGESIEDSELMKLRARGLKMAELVGHFGVSEKTIRQHLQNIADKHPSAVKDYAQQPTAK